MGKGQIFKIAGAIGFVVSAGSAAFAQTATPVGGRARQSLGEEVVSTLIFGLLGIILCVIGFKIFDLVIKADIEKEIFDNKNIAAALLAGAVVLGVSFIIAASILS